MAWVRKRAVYPQLPDDPAATSRIVDAFEATVRAALAKPEFSFARLSKLLGGTNWPLDVIVEHFPFDVFEDLYADAAQAVQQQVVEAGHRVGRETGWRFHDRDLNVIFWTRTHAAQLITALTDSQRRSLNQLLLARTLDMSSVDQLAAELRAIIGLHPAWANAVTRYHSKLLSDGASAAYARRAAERYQTRLIRSRAEMIARTEVMAAQNMGQKIGWTQALTAGSLPEGALMQWVAAIGHPTPPCAVCAALHGVTVPVVGGEFQTSVRLASGLWRLHRAEAPPIHPRCRCRLTLVTPLPRAEPGPIMTFPLAPYGPSIPQPPPRPQYTISSRRTSRSVTPLNPRRTNRSTFRKTL